MALVFELYIYTQNMFGGTVVSYSYGIHGLEFENIMRKYIRKIKYVSLFIISWRDSLSRIIEVQTIKMIPNMTIFDPQFLIEIHTYVIGD